MRVTHLRGYGNLIIIKHNDDFLSAYAHNDKILVSDQQEVKAGQEIAKMGSTGTNAVKLHFEIRYKGKSVDPVRYLPRKIIFSHKKVRLKMTALFCYTLTNFFLNA